MQALIVEMAPGPTKSLATTLEIFADKLEEAHKNQSLELKLSNPEISPFLSSEFKVISAPLFSLAAKTTPPPLARMAALAMLSRSPFLEVLSLRVDMKIQKLRSFVAKLRHLAHSLHCNCPKEGFAEQNGLAILLGS